MRQFLIIFASILFGTGFASAQYDDDIYYNPSKVQKNKPAAATTSTKQSSASASYFNPNLGENAVLSEYDIDAYNGFGGYYETAVDTIGMNIANSDDFVYTQQIQKFYNPTIVTDNSAVLADVLQNSYGNVNIIYNGGVPTLCSWNYLSPWYSYSYWPYAYPYYNWGYIGWVDPWYWGPSWTWGWNSPWYWGPSWYGPGYAWSYPSYHHWNNYHRNPGAGRPMANHNFNRGLGRNFGTPGAGNHMTAGNRGGNIRGNAGRLGTTARGNMVAPNGNRGIGSTSVNSHRGEASRGNVTSPSVTRNPSTNQSHTTTTPSNRTPSINTNSHRGSSSNGSFRNSGGSRGGMSSGGARMGGGGSRGGGGGHRR